MAKGSDVTTARESAYAGIGARSIVLTAVGNPVVRSAGELGLATVAFLLYFVVRANVIDRPDLALSNALHLIDVERALGIYVEASWQRWALDNYPVVKLANFAYFWLDFPLIAALGLLMYFRRRPQYRLARDAILLSGLLALFCYALVPLAPPRLTPEAGVIDTLQAYSNLSYQAQSTSFFVNPYAALPSLHVGWALLIAIGVISAWPGNRIVLLLALLHPFAQWAATVVTGNHYFLDGVGGVAAAAAGLALALSLQRWGYPAVGRWLRVGERAGPPARASRT